MIPESHLDLLLEPVTVAYVTMMPDGMPQCTPVWCTYDGTHIIVNASVNRQKDRNVRRNPNVAILAIDPQDPYRYLEVRGVVEEVTSEGAGENMNELSLQYRGIPKRYGIEAPPPEVDLRTLHKIRPVRVIAR
jgi:PPOX class probable F420-dependent enzyme